MRQAFEILHIETRGKGLYDISERVQRAVTASGIANGLVTLLLAHTSASLLIQENADPEVRRDLERFFTRLVPEGDPLFRHVEEGPDDMPAHVRTALTQTSIGIPFRSMLLTLGTWQGLYLYEHRHRPHTRTLHLHMLGE